MNVKNLSILFLFLVTVVTAKSQEPDSLKILVQQGDSCMLQYDTFGALTFYQRASEMARRQDSVCVAALMRLADCHYKRANYRQTSDILKNIPEDSLSHEAFRKLVISYKKLGNIDSYIYWAGLLVGYFPMDGEVVAGLTRALAQKDQPHVGLKYGLEYCQRDSCNILVNRAVADAFFLDRKFYNAAVWYERLLEEGDSTFNTLYSAGMCLSQMEDYERAYLRLRDALFLSQMQHYGCAYRLGVVCVNTSRYEEGLDYLNLALELMKPDTAVMKAITLSQGEGYYLTKQYAEAVEAWKQHLAYNPGSIATYYNIANATYFFLSDDQQAKTYYEKFLELARKEKTPTPQLTDMIMNAEELLRATAFRKSPKPKSI